MALERQTSTRADSSSINSQQAGGAANGDVWRLPAGVRFDRRIWDDEIVLYEHASGQTHLLDALSDRVLVAFEQRSWTLAALAALLAHELGVNEKTLRNRLDTIVHEFAHLGLLDADAT